MSGMTREEAIEIITSLPVYRAELIYGGNSDLAKALEMAIADMEKQIPKKVITKPYKGIYIRDYCPTCGEEMCSENYAVGYCDKCGQALRGE